MKILFSITVLFALSIHAFGQSKTWGGAGKTLYPNAAAGTFVIDYGGTNSLTVNNTNTASTGTLARFQSQGTNMFQFFRNGSVYNGSKALTAYGAPSYPTDLTYRNTADGDLTRLYKYNYLYDGANIESAFNLDLRTTTGALSMYRVNTSTSESSRMEFLHDTSSSSLELLGTQSGGANSSSLYLQRSPTLVNIIGTLNSTRRLSLSPTTASGNSMYFLDTATAKTNNLFTVKNNGTNQFNVGPTGAITTSSPGAGAGEWKLGTVQAAAVTASITNYVEVNINGTVYKLIIANP